MKTIAAALFACTLLLAGCGGSGGSGGSDTAAPVKGVTIDIAIKDGKVTPQGERVNVKVGQKITLHVTSDADEEVHVHSEPEHEYELAPGDDKTYTFSLKVPGQVAVEAHHLDVTIAQLVVRP
jgi:plastocyanin